jgi:hypothetical protein
LEVLLDARKGRIAPDFTEDVGWDDAKIDAAGEDDILHVL